MEQIHWMAGSQEENWHCCHQVPTLSFKSKLVSAEFQQLYRNPFCSRSRGAQCRELFLQRETVSGSTMYDAWLRVRWMHRRVIVAQQQMSHASKFNKGPVSKDWSYNQLIHCTMNFWAIINSICFTKRLRSISIVGIDRKTLWIDHRLPLIKYQS